MSYVLKSNVLFRGPNPYVVKDSIASSIEETRIRINEQLEEIGNMQVRVEAIFQGLMSTMSMVESQKAIAQAEVISKLTSLAFFFIPLTFVTGIFGMNIVVSCISLIRVLIIDTRVNRSSRISLNPGCGSLYRLPSWRWSTP